MKARLTKLVRCAIYTRVSTDHGLEQDFNSLDAQYEAAQAYIKSQAHAGWSLIRAKYDDGGFSGGNTERPALQHLLQDVRAGKIDVIVVYKVDRLTRSLADFVKLVELFDQHQVSFVSVTQQFNTTTSMGRLTLNVLLSFAQFEREVTSERIRDKIAASKRKGLWVGGMAPLGYDTRDRKITVNKAEAQVVQTIFKTYLQLGNLTLLLADLRKRSIVTKVRTLKTGKTVGGIPFTRGPLAHLLRNRFYVGEVLFKGEILTGEQVAIIDRALFDAVQARLTEQLNCHNTERMNSDALLMGRIFNDRGNRMSPSHARKHGVRYRYYLSSALLQGQAEKAGSIRRVTAPEIEAVILKSVRQHVKPASSMDDRGLIETHVARVEVHPDRLIIHLAQVSKPGRQKSTGKTPLNVPWHKAPMTRRREILLPAGIARQHARPIRSESRALLVASIARGRRWLAELLADANASTESIARRERCSVRKINMTISLAFIAPDLVQAAVTGRLPRGIGLARLIDMPAEWSRQHQMLGLPENSA
ncbi:MAG: recombinase family protein [Pseudorhodoplanes sp.]|nr:recombinase family protein [Pseudorhodoplanes sp.]